MRTSDVDILIVPGPSGGSADDHWYGRWEAKLPTARLVAPADGSWPAPETSTERLVAAVEAATRPVVVVAHGLGALVVAQAAERIAGRVVGAFLVAPPVSGAAVEGSDPASTDPASSDPALADAPNATLPFPTVLVASRDDPGANWDASTALAHAWGAELVDAGASGGLDAGSGHGPWPEGLMRFAGFLKSLGPRSER